MLMWTQTGWRWARGSVLVYFQLLMTSLSLQYVSTTASLKKASTTWSSICKCQSQGPLALCHSQHGALGLLRFRKSSVPTSGHSLSALLQGVTSFPDISSLPTSDLAMRRFLPTSLCLTCRGHHAESWEVGPVEGRPQRAVGAHAPSSLLRPYGCKSCHARHSWLARACVFQHE